MITLKLQWNYGIKVLPRFTMFPCQRQLDHVYVHNNIEEILVNFFNVIVYVIKLSLTVKHCIYFLLVYFQ